MSITLTPADLQGILEFTVGLARTAGNLILEGSNAIQYSNSQETGVGEKKNSVDLVTEYDVKVEELVKKNLAAKYPGYSLSVRLYLSRQTSDLSQYRRGVFCWRSTSAVVGRAHLLCGSYW